MNSILDIAGIGIGPFNLSLALMLFEKTSLKLKFFDRKPEFSWHDGMKLPDSKMQIHFLKDLVTPINPTSKFSFLNYLAEKGLIYSFLNRDETVISREEFTQYMQWIVRDLDKVLEFGSKIEEVKFNGEDFDIIQNSAKYKAKHLVIGTGIKPNIPEVTKKMISQNFFHNHEFAFRAKNLNFKGKKVVIIGGGQSGAEILEFLLSSQDAPSEITVLYKRINFGVLEDTPFANEFHHPSYVDLFYDFPTDSKGSLLKEQLLTSDGISKELLFSIYKKLYDLKYVKNSHLKVQFLPNHNLVDAFKCGKSYKLDFEDFIMLSKRYIDADIVILATGYSSYVPEFLAHLIPEVAELNKDYSLISNNKIFIQNFARKSHGISDPKS